MIEVIILSITGVVITGIVGFSAYKIAVQMTMYHELQSRVKSLEGEVTELNEGLRHHRFEIERLDKNINPSEIANVRKYRGSSAVPPIGGI